MLVRTNAQCEPQFYGISLGATETGYEAQVRGGNTNLARRTSVLLRTGPQSGWTHPEGHWECAGDASDYAHRHFIQDGRREAILLALCRAVEWPPSNRTGGFVDGLLLDELRR